MIPWTWIAIFTAAVNMVIYMNQTKFSVVAAEAIKYHRKQAGLTQHELADFAGIGKTVVFDLEHAKPSVRLDTLLSVLSVLNIKLELKSAMSGFDS